MSFFRRKHGKKFGNKKVEVYGYSFDSKLEASVHQILLLMEKAGEISNLRHHPGTVFLSAARIRYQPDFTFMRVASGVQEWAEAKGFPGPRWPTQKKMWKHYGPGPLHIYMGSHASPRLVETITPKGGVDELEGRPTGNRGDEERDQE